MRKTLVAAFLALTLMFIGESKAASTSAAVGTSGGWLGLPSSVRAAGLGGAYVAVSDDVGAMNINPAGLAQLKGNQVSFMHNGWIEGLIEEQGRFSFDLGGATLAIGAGYFNGGDVDRITLVGGIP